MTFQVVELSGDFEPWWMLEDWKEDLQSIKEFDRFYDALKYYKDLWFCHQDKYESYDSRRTIMTAFWDEEDQRWCEECDEDLQQYHSIALLKDWEEIPENLERPGYEKKNNEANPMTCSVKF